MQGAAASLHFLCLMMARIEVPLRRGSGCGTQRVLYEQWPSRSAQRTTGDMSRRGIGEDKAAGLYYSSSDHGCTVRPGIDFFMFGNRPGQVAKYFALVVDQRVPQFLQRSHSHRGERIGEASHPGPSKWRSIPLHTWEQDGSELKNGFALLSSDPA